MRGIRYGAYLFLAMFALLCAGCVLPEAFQEFILVTIDKTAEASAARTAEAVARGDTNSAALGGGITAAIVTAGVILKRVFTNGKVKPPG